MKKLTLDGEKPYNLVEISKNSKILTNNTSYLFSAFTVKEGVKVHVPKLKVIGFSPSSPLGASFVEMLPSVGGSRLRQYSGLKVINTRITLLKGSKLTAPKLKSVAALTIGEKCAVYLPNVENIYGCLNIGKDSVVNFPNLKVIHGELNVDQAAKFYAPKLEEVRKFRMLTLDEL